MVLDWREHSRASGVYISACGNYMIKPTATELECHIMHKTLCNDGITRQSWQKLATAKDYAEARGVIEKWKNNKN